MHVEQLKQKKWRERRKNRRVLKWSHSCFYQVSYRLINKSVQKSTNHDDGGKTAFYLTGRRLRPAMNNHSGVMILSKVSMKNIVVTQHLVSHKWQTAKGSEWITWSVRFSPHRHWSGHVWLPVGWFLSAVKTQSEFVRRTWKRQLMLIIISTGWRRIFIFKFKFFPDSVSQKYHSFM